MSEYDAELRNSGNNLPLHPAIRYGSPKNLG